MFDVCGLGAGEDLVNIQPMLGSGPTVSFSERLAEDDIRLCRSSLGTLQVNTGKLCNQACHHCHVDASPARTEIMTRETIDRILGFLEASEIHTVDITGGAPELIPDFRYFVSRIKSIDRHVIDRCNLTVIFEPGQKDLVDFYAENHIELVCSLPCYSEENVDAQRGHGVFYKSIRALQILNRRGYGKPASGLELHLVYNPVGASLPPPQEELANDYRVELLEQFGIVFNQLFTITNMPINRFSSYLKRRNEYEDYTYMLRTKFNAATIPRLMCRSQISVDWMGNVFDCDFNQMLDMHIAGAATKIWDYTPEALVDRFVRVDDHCFGCTAGAGSSCGGELL
ncbi:MAG: arsenosugar biosynthesis radical SAM (seleno)protein ArsS [Candidatus Latescibacterota bacterium]|nr:arsenosugar biosynthesis radical SAM (seleno)protein ArsS [Candidatus Latescibacterota bacterium]